ncbi:MAG: hypothetical protein ACP5NX_03130 [Candidatus Bilamarchaeaceae archaeon]
MEMSDKVRYQDIAKYVELKKKIAESSFKLEYLISQGKKNEFMESELRELRASLAKTEERLSQAKLTVVIPDKQKIDAINSELSKFSAKEVGEALSSKAGRVYDLLSARGVLVKRNYRRRNDIGKLNIMLAKLRNGNKQKLVDMVTSGIVDDMLFLEDSNEDERMEVVKLLRRVGFDLYLNGNMISPEKNAESRFPSEVEIAAPDMELWVPAEMEPKVSEKIRQIEELSRDIQMKNAERQIKTFSEAEETQYQETQKKYLGLLNERDSLIADFLKENEAYSIKF